MSRIRNKQCRCVKSFNRAISLCRIVTLALVLDTLHPHFVHHENGSLQFSVGSFKRVDGYPAFEIATAAIDGVDDHFMLLLLLAIIFYARANGPF